MPILRRERLRQRHIPLLLGGMGVAGLLAAAIPAIGVGGVLRASLPRPVPPRSKS